MKNGVVIVGAGHAGVQAAASLREDGYDGPVILVGDENELPYHKPPLSKTFIKDAEAKPQPLRGEAFYTGNAIDSLTLATWSNDPNFPAVFLATAGTTYQIAIDGAPGAEGNIQLNVHYGVFPTISLTSPANGDSFAFGTAIHLAANANDSDGFIREVLFDIDGGAHQFRVNSSPYEFDWTPDTQGQHRVTAIATDNDNLGAVDEILVIVQ